MIRASPSSDLYACVGLTHKGHWLDSITRQRSDSWRADGDFTIAGLSVLEPEFMAIYEGWTFAAARGASRRSLHEIADAVQTGPAALERLEHARDINLADRNVDVALVERVLELYARLGYHIWPRSFWRAACLKRVQ